MDGRRKKGCNLVLMYDLDAHQKLVCRKVRRSVLALRGSFALISYFDSLFRIHLYHKLKKSQEEVRRKWTYENGEVTW
uniref:CRISPR-associated endonuclease Cas2 n=1 Tax=Steinernema glaseri TaxID=37863 RepID=A0A1I7ZZ07_9BILA